MSRTRFSDGSRSRVASCDRGEGADQDGSIWDSVIHGLASVGLSYLLRLLTSVVDESLGVPGHIFWGTLLGIWLLWSIVKWVIDTEREDRAAKVRAIERVEIEQARIAREERFKAGHRLP